MDGKSKNTKGYFYPRPPRGGRPAGVSAAAAHIEISIHALREEGDLELVDAVESSSEFLSTPSARRATQLDRVLAKMDKISIHALREEGDLYKTSEVLDLLEFLSTPSARRATFFQAAKGGLYRDFYPRPPRGGRRFGSKTYQSFMLFLSTPSARRATMALPSHGVP